MKLEINGEEIAFELENEQTLKDVVRSVVEYLQTNGFIDVQIMADGKKLELQDTSWYDQPIKEIEHMQVHAQTAYDFEQCIKILHLGKEALESGNQEDIDKIMSLWPRFVLSLHFWLSDFHLGDGYFNTMMNIPNLLPQMNEKQELRAQILRMMELSIHAIQEKGRELEHPKEELLLAITQLQDFREPLTGLAVLFQNGKDAQAMQEILVFMELFQKLMRTASFLPAEEQEFRQKIAQLAEAFSDKMKEFTQACETRDYVLAADLAEYEIVPHLDSLDELKTLLS